VALKRPQGLSDDHWNGIEAHETRLDSAVQQDDRSGVVGAAKELCECVASVVCAEQAQTISTSDDFAKVITSAHEALDRRPGRGAAVEGSVRNIAQSARKIAIEVNTLRNEAGTGHGRSTVPIVTRETATIAEQAARLWSSWALARLDEVLRGEVAGLVQELDTGGGWRRGLLVERLAEVGLGALHSEDQHRLGVAVARRSTDGGTFVVSEAGVSPLRHNAESWPPSYRSGVAAGLLLSASGRLTLRGRFVPDLAAIVALMDADEWRVLADQAATALWTPDLTRDTDRQLQVAQLMESLSATLDVDRRRGWDLLEQRLRTEGDSAE
jgi:hypothetical protein